MCICIYIPSLKKEARQVVALFPEPMTLTLRGLAVRFPGYRTDMYCDSCEVRTEFIYLM
jgi:hypothetical protein